MCGQLSSTDVALKQCQILIQRSGRAERYNVTLCTLLVVQTFKSGFTTALKWRVLLVKIPGAKEERRK